MYFNNISTIETIVLEMIIMLRLSEIIDMILIK